MSAEVLDALTKRTQDGGTEVVQAKAGKVGWPWQSCIRHVALPDTLCFC